MEKESKSFQMEITFKVGSCLAANSDKEPTNSTMEMSILENFTMGYQMVSGN